MTRIAKALDDTRPVTYSGNNGPTFAGANGAAEVRGVNYIRGVLHEDGRWLDRYHADHPISPSSEPRRAAMSSAGAAQGRIWATVFWTPPAHHHALGLDSQGLGKVL